MSKQRSTPDDPKTLTVVLDGIRNMTDEDWDRVLTQKPEGVEDPWAEDVAAPQDKTSE